MSDLRRRIEAIEQQQAAAVNPQRERRDLLDIDADAALTDDDLRNAELPPGAIPVHPDDLADAEAQSIIDAALAGDFDAWKQVVDAVDEPLTPTDDDTN